MDPLAIHGLPLHPVAGDNTPRDRGQAKQDASRRDAAKNDASEHKHQESEAKGDGQEALRRSSDGIVGTVIDVEA
jgi:hypothetical protein